MRGRATEIQVGLFLLGALIFFVVTIFTLGKERQIFARQEEYVTRFKDVKGLSEGAAVRLGGISIGRVDDIGFSEELNDRHVHVRMLINEDYLERIRSDSKVSIETQGLLGDKFLSVSIGTSEKKQLPGSEIPGIEAADIAEVLTKAGEVVDNTAEISEHVKVFLKDFREKSMDQLSSAIKSVSNLSNEIESGNGLIHRLIYSKKDGQDIVDSMAQVSKDLRAIMHEVKNGEGLLHALVYDPSGKEAVKALTSAAQNLAGTAEYISQLSEEIITGEGLLHDLIYTKSPEGLDEIVKKLNETAANLRRASEALAEGSGTIGALLIDSQLYDNLVEVTDGAKRSLILRHAIRSSLDK